MAKIEHAIGVDVGGTKIAAGVVRLADGAILARRLQPTAPQRGGRAVLDDVIQLAQSLLAESRELGVSAGAVGIGLAELVSPHGEVLSAATIDWLRQDVAGAIQRATQLDARIDADVRAAALAEARYGAGMGRQVFLYVTVGTGISACLVIDGVPFTGARGLTGTFASSPMFAPAKTGDLEFGPTLEAFASGLGLPEQFRRIRPSFKGDAREVLRIADEEHQNEVKLLVYSAGVTLGRGIGNLVNMLDPEVVVLGGGLGLNERYTVLIETGLRQQVWSRLHKDIPVLKAQLGADAGLVGAAACVTLPGRGSE